MATAEARIARRRDRSETVAQQDFATDGPDEHAPLMSADPTADFANRRTIVYETVPNVAET